MLIQIVLSIVILYNSFSLGSDTGDDDEINGLPGLEDESNFRQYSGYFDIRKGRHFHYWFVESQNDPQNDPLILWLNGGPGCSSLGAFWTGHGPYRVLEDGQTLVENPYSWNSLANVLYLESPAGTGYSYQDNTDTFITDDNETAKDNYLALLKFFQKFPQFTSNNFYITGESYAGVYIPMLALKILEGNSTINLKGLAIGNGSFNQKLKYNTRIRLAFHHGLFDTEAWNKLEAKCCKIKKKKQVCNFAKSKSKYCNPGHELRKILLKQGINPYNIYDDCHHLDPQNADIRFSNTSYNDLNIHSDIGYDEMEDDYDYYALKPKCISDGYITYMNSMDVRDAIHIPTDVKEWIKCKTGLPQFVYDRQHKNMKPEFLKLINKHKIKPFIVFNGDLDLVCDFMGCQLFIDKLKLSLTQKYQPWYYNGVVGGFVKRYDGLTFITVRAAGHMVSTDKPGLGLKIIRELLGIENI